MSKIKLGVSLFSFTGEFISNEWSLEDCLRTVSELGVEGFELVGSQMLRTYPYVTDDYLKYFNNLCAKHNVKILSYGANMDRGMRADRDLTNDEMLARTVNDIKTAWKLGCRLMRVQYMIPPEVMARLAPYAEEYDVRLGVEIHNPETPSTAAIRRYIEVFERVGSHHLGFVPDFGSFATRPNKGSIDFALAMGASRQALDYAIECCYDKVPQREARAGMLKLNADPFAMGAFEDMYAFLTFYREPDYAGLRSILPWVQYFHGKFHHIDENLVEASIPYPELIELIQASGFTGSIVSEYEGHGETLTMVKRHLELERKLLARA